MLRSILRPYKTRWLAALPATDAALLQLRSWLNRPNLKVQLSLLNEIEAYRLVGQGGGIDRRIRSLRAFRYFCTAHPKLLGDELSLSRKLELLCFHPQIVTAVRSSEKTGNAGGGIAAAISFCELLLDVKAKTAGKLYLGALLIILAGSALLIIPGYVVAAVRQLLVVPELAIEANTATAILFWIADNQAWLVFGLLLIPALGAAGYLLRGDLLSIPTMRSLLSPFLRYVGCRRSLKFLLIWMLYKTSGNAIDNDEQALRSALGPRVYTNVRLRMSEGASIHSAIIHESGDFSPLLSEPVAALSALTGNSFETAAERIVKLLADDQKFRAGRLAVVFNTVLLIISGVILPVMNVDPRL